MPKAPLLVIGVVGMSLAGNNVAATSSRVAVTMTWQLLNISHHNVSGAEKAEYEIEGFLQRELAHDMGSILGKLAPDLVNVRLDHPLKDHLDVGFEIFEQTDPKMRELVRQWAPDIKAHILAGKEPNYTSPVGKAIAEHEDRRRRDRKLQDRLPVQKTAVVDGDWRRLLSKPTCKQATDNYKVAIINIFLSMSGIPSKLMKTILKKYPRKAAEPQYIKKANSWICKAASDLWREGNYVAAILSYASQAWTAGVWSIVTLIMGEELTIWQYVAFGVQFLAQIVAWISPPGYGLAAMLTKF
jgi:hypothetical protein